jgi:hypothetical protein
MTVHRFGEAMGEHESAKEPPANYIQSVFEFGFECLGVLAEAEANRRRV